MKRWYQKPAERCRRSEAKDTAMARLRREEGWQGNRKLPKESDGERELLSQQYVGEHPACRSTVAAGTETTRVCHRVDAGDKDVGFFNTTKH